MLAPRVNAAGRMSTPDIATRLLLASDEAMGEEARALAQQLDGENVRRQEEEAEILAAAQEDRPDRSRGRRAHRCSSSPARAGIAASSASSPRSWSTRFIGRRSCCRSRATWRTGRAAAFRTSTCSARSSAAPTCFIRFGGHKQAAGLTMDAGAHPGAARWPSTTSPTRRSGPDDLMPRLRIDGDLAFRGITGGVAAGVAALAPFGAGNPRPGVCRARRRDRRRSAQAQGAPPQDGAAGRTAASSGPSPGGRPSATTTWPSTSARLDVAFSLEQNQYNGETYVELTLASTSDRHVRLWALGSLSRDCRYVPPQSSVSQSTMLKWQKSHGRDWCWSRRGLRRPRRGDAPGADGPAGCSPRRHDRSQGRRRERRRGHAAAQPRARSRFASSTTTLLTYADGSTKMLDVTVTTERDGRNVRRSQATKGRSGSARLDDRACRATCTLRPATAWSSRPTARPTLDSDGIVRAPGPVDFSRGRMTGSGVGLTYDKNQDMLTILDQAVVHVDARRAGRGRDGHRLRRARVPPQRAHHSLRPRDEGARANARIIEADTAVAHLTADEEQLEAVELRGQSRITGPKATSGGVAGD